MDTLKLGDKVCVTKAGEYPFLVGRTGVVCWLSPGHPHVGIRFDEYCDGFHNCQGTCTYGYGYFAWYENVTKMVPVNELLQTFRKS